MSTSPIKITITGAAGQIGYALVFRIASGEIFGPNTPISLSLLEIEPAMKALEGVAMELDDCAFETLKEINITSDINKGFDGCQLALLVGSIPRKEGMERNDLLEVNGKIFKPQGQALEKNADESVRILVIGNPCNTNCLIARANAPSIPDDRWFAMTRLDENRARTMLSKKAGVELSKVTKIAIWGNHSSTQYPDFYNAKIDGKPVVDVIGEEDWLKNTFIKAVQQRGAEIIKARGASSAASAANAIIDSVKTIYTKTEEDNFHSLSVVCAGQYGIDEGLIFSFPVVCDGESVKVVEGLAHNEFSRQKIEATRQELFSEKSAVLELGLI